MAHKSALQDDDLDDLDDLDDIVDQFDITRPTNDSSSSSNALAQSTSVPSSSSKDKPEPTRPASASGPDGQLPDDLEKQLAEDMKSLLRELSGGNPTSEEERKRREVWEKMLVDGMNNMEVDEITGRESRGKPSETGEAEASTKKAADHFQASVLQAMEKLKDSDSTLHTESSTPGASGDPLDDLLSKLSAGPDESDEDNGDLQDMLETMMQQLMGKEVLYEPLKELHDKFPSYLSENDQKLSREDKERFKNQRIRVAAIVKIFEDPSYKDDDQEKGAQIVTLMNEMQSFGSPPSEIMGPLPPGLDLGPDGAPNLPEGCSIM